MSRSFEIIKYGHSKIFDGQLKETFKIELTIQPDIIESFRFCSLLLNLVIVFCY